MLPATKFAYPVGHILHHLPLNFGISVMEVRVEPKNSRSGMKPLRDARRERLTSTEGYPQKFDGHSPNYRPKL